MPYRKFKPWKQYGRFNTRFFKNILRKKKETDCLPFYIDPELAASNIEIYDPVDKNFFNQFSHENVTFENPKHLSKPQIEDHPLFKTSKCYLFESEIPLTDGMDEACSIIKAPRIKSFLNNFFTNSLLDDIFTNGFEKQVMDAIMHGERYDPTLDKLPKKFDPVIFWTYQERMYGTPVVKRNNIIMCNLYRKVLFASIKENSILSDSRCDFDAPLSSFLPNGFSGFKSPLVLRQQPHLTIQTEKPLRLLADSNEVEATRSMKVPNIYPISSVIDLMEEHIYNDTAVVPRSTFSNLNINTVFSSKLPIQKYPWTTEQYAANAILNCFGAAVAQATRNGKIEFIDQNSKVLKRPIVTKAVQLINGKLDLVAVQLNTLNLSRTEEDNDIKNLVWVEKAAHLYKPKHFYENMDEVVDFNFETFQKFAAFLLY